VIVDDYEPGVAMLCSVADKQINSDPARFAAECHTCCNPAS